MTVTGRVGGGGLGPSNAAAAPRALLIIAVAVILGLVLLWKGLDTTPGVAVSPEATDDGSAESVGMVEEGTADLPIADEPMATTTSASTTTTSTTAVPAPTRPPNQVRVLVANGSGVPRGAATVTGVLSPAGYTTLPPANATPTDASGIYYRSGYSGDARAVMDIVAPGNPDLLLPLPPGGLDVPDGTLDRVADANVVVILGADLRINR
ncbi:uncharacterized protein METZ01_LOCUS358742 [marine metagenome]|uniref:LytR/CpsA/Psr regulator C-terminal domain-containing protein n=1 Tax=marine metagenome TaxID=408172 RepID=A0A382S9R6_9ZZZZ